MNEYDAAVILGLFLGLFLAATLIGIYIFVDIRLLGLLGPIVGILAIYITQRREWLRNAKKEKEDAKDFRVSVERMVTENDMARVEIEDREEA